jgi:hypothetical protein
MDTTTDIVMNDSLDTELENSEGTDIAKAIAGFAAIAAIAGVSYFGLGRLFSKSPSKEQNDKNIADYLAVLEACDTPAK